MKEFADDNFKFDENGRKLSKLAENTVGKGEIPRYEQFLLFPQCFQKACFPGASKGVNVWEWVKTMITISSMSLLMTLRKKPFENVVGKGENAGVGKGENAGNQHFLLFPQCLLPTYRQNSLS